MQSQWSLGLKNRELKYSSITDRCLEAWRKKHVLFGDSSLRFSSWLSFRIGEQFNYLFKPIKIESSDPSDSEIQISEPPVNPCTKSRMNDVGRKLSWRRAFQGSRNLATWWSQANVTLPFCLTHKHKTTSTKPYIPISFFSLNRRHGLRATGKASEFEGIQVFRCRPFPPFSICPQTVLHSRRHKMFSHVDGPEFDHPYWVFIRYH